MFGKYKMIREEIEEYLKRPLITPYNGSYDIVEIFERYIDKFMKDDFEEEKKYLQWGISEELHYIRRGRTGAFRDVKKLL